MGGVETAQLVTFSVLHLMLLNNRIALFQLTKSPDITKLIKDRCYETNL